MNSKSGIYFLIRDREIIYIGKTTDYPNRPFHNHNISKKEYDVCRFIEYPEKDLDRFERAYIKKYRPINNKRLKPKIKKKKVITLKKRKMRFRQLSRKSFIDFGRWRELKVGALIDTDKHIELASMYYKLSHISFLPEVLEELGIIDDWVIDKPGVNKDKFYQFIENVYPNQYEILLRRREIYKRKRSKSILRHTFQADNNKAYHQSINQRK